MSVRQKSGPTFDVAVIGGGSAGYAAARTAGRLGARCVVIDGSDRLGGLCILRGCMPTKTLLESSHRLHAIHQAKEFGITVQGVRADLKKIVARKNRLIGEFADYREKQLTSGKFKLIRGFAKFLDSHRIQIISGAKTQVITARTVVLAGGSKVSLPDIPGLGEVGFWTSDEAINVEKLPKRLAVLGGGAIACEFAQYFANLGSQVTLIQRSPDLIRGFDPDVAAVVAKVFRDQGIKVETGTELLAVGGGAEGRWVRYRKAGRSRKVEVDEILVALGREPNTDSLNLEAAGVETNRKGGVVVRDTQQSSVSHVFAAGDVCGPYEVVHTAIQQGEFAAENAVALLAGKEPFRKMDYRNKLAVIFTEPEVASIGLTEGEATEKKIPYETAQYPFNDHGKSIVMGALDGFVKIIAHGKTGEILGASIVGPRASDMIHEFVPLIHFKATVQEFITMPHYHPTLAEIVTYPAEEIAENLEKKKR